MKNLLNNKFWMLMALCSLVFFSACDDDDDPEIPNEQEVITDMTFTLTSGTDVVTLTFSDPDGEGGNAPVITGGTLQANTTYTGGIVLLNNTESPAENITLEIEEEDDEHQFFFSTSGGLDLNVSYQDTDGDGNPLGLATSVVAGAASQGNFTVILRHEPNKGASGVANGDITNAGGETDIEVTFPVTIQ